MRRDVVVRQAKMVLIVLHNDRLQVARVATQLSGSLVSFFRYWMIRWVSHSNTVANKWERRRLDQARPHSVAAVSKCAAVLRTARSKLQNATTQSEPRPKGMIVSETNGRQKERHPSNTCSVLCSIAD